MILELSCLNLNRQLPSISSLLLDRFGSSNGSLRNWIFHNQKNQEQNQLVTNLDWGIFVPAYAEILSEGQQVHSCDFDAGIQCAHYASLLWHYGVTKTKDGYKSDNEDPPRPRNSYLQTIDESALVTLE
ncbi:putative protein EIN4-like [Capsicum annuum]|nr:putative protein EIN4-like [Capsicum annuum]